jgi:hypothetical protein
MAGTIEFVHPKSKWKLGDRVIAVTTGWRWEDITYGKSIALKIIMARLGLRCFKWTTFAYDLVKASIANSTTVILK